MGATAHTQADVDAEIAKLNELREKISVTHPFTVFGDDNVAAIDAQIEVLTERMDEDEVCDRFPGEESDNDEDDDAAIADPHVHNAARDALDWLTGDSDELPSAGWSSLTEAP